MERRARSRNIFDRSKISFLGGIASIDEGLGSIFGKGPHPQVRRFYTTEEDPGGAREDAAAIEENWKTVGNDLEKILGRREK
jgi:hypothetical protein